MEMRGSVSRKGRCRGIIKAWIFYGRWMAKTTKAEENSWALMIVIVVIFLIKIYHLASAFPLDARRWRGGGGVCEGWQWGFHYRKSVCINKVMRFVRTFIIWFLYLVAWEKGRTARTDKNLCGRRFYVANEWQQKDKIMFMMSRLSRGWTAISSFYTLKVQSTKWMTKTPT